MSMTIGIVFDFDDTLAPDSTSDFLRTLGVDPPPFWAHTVQALLDDDWDPIPAYLHKMIELSQQRPAGERITREMLRAFGATITCYEGVEEMFDALTAEAKAIDPEVNVEFYLISSGIGEILRASPIASRFRDIWACDFQYNDDSEIVFPKNIVSFTEKTKFMYKISKGFVGERSRGKPFEVNKRIERTAYRIPFNQMIVIGDGQTDVPCFALAERYGGVPFGVYDPEHPGKWDRAFSFITNRRVKGLYTANYRKGGDLRNALIMAVHAIARQIVDRAAHR